MTDATNETLNTVWSTFSKWGPWVILVFYLLGAIPGLPSQQDRASAEHTVQNTNLEKSLKALRGICYRLKGTDDKRTDCE